jgi:hypothetical protein
MLSAAKRAIGSRLEPIAGVLALAVLSAGAARAEEPDLRHGLWQFERTVGDRKLQTQECTDPNDEMERQNAMLGKGGCRLSPAKRTGNTYTFTAECAVKAPGGETVTARSTSVMTVQSDSAYTVDITTTGAGTTTQERLVARRIRDCTK